MSALIVIPARLHSTRLPEKLLLRETGKSLIQHTYESARRSGKAARVVVATDHPAIFSEVQSFGGEVVMTSPDHPSGTDRVAEVATAHPEIDVVVNVQGDEPELAAESIDMAISILESTPEAKISTLAAPIRTPEQRDDPNCVKVVINRYGEALYFSRAPIPFPRNATPLDAKDSVYLQHIGLYAYRRDVLLRIPQLPQPALEIAESLEQLRCLFAGIPIFVGVIDQASPGIDTAEDYAAFVSRTTNR